MMSFTSVQTARNGLARSFMSDKTKVFFDSNILVYFADGADPQKQMIAEKETISKRNNRPLPHSYENVTVTKAMENMGAEFDE